MPPVHAGGDPARMPLPTPAERPVQNDPQSSAESELLVCVKCRRGAEAPADDRRPGRRLYDRLCALGPPEGVRLRAVECLQNCEAGCTVALRGADRWTYVYGQLDDEAHAETLQGIGWIPSPLRPSKLPFENAVLIPRPRALHAHVLSALALVFYPQGRGLDL